MVQEPADTPVTVLPFIPETAHTLGVRLTKVTGLPDAPPVALAKVEPPTAKMEGVKVIGPMVWLALATTMLCVTVGAAL